MVKTSGAYSTTEGSVCVHLTCPSMECMMSWGFYEFDELSFDEMTQDRCAAERPSNIFLKAFFL